MAHPLMDELKKIAVGRIVLDIGCGKGSFRSTEWTYIGLDLPNNRYGQPIVYGDARMLPFRDSSVDIVIIKDVLTISLAWKKIIAEAARVTRGCLFCLDNGCWRVFFGDDKANFPETHYIREKEIMVELRANGINNWTRDDLIVCRKGVPPWAMGRIAVCGVKT